MQRLKRDFGFKLPHPNFGGRRWRWLWRAKKRTRILILKLRIKLKRFRRWWQKNDRRYGWRWRTANAVVAVLVLASIILPTVAVLVNDNRYTLDDSAKQLVGQPDQSLAKQLTYDAGTQTYEFNKSAVSTSSSLPKQVQQNLVGNADKKNDQTYALDVPADISKGVTYHDINSQLDFTLVPNFKALSGKTVDNHLVYPLDGGNQAVYTLKGNGLKEDIIVPKVSGDTMSFSYKLDLPDTLEAKLIPDSSGAVGIYSADPSLFGNISYGSSADEARVQKARIDSAKTTLVFALPAPIIKTADGSSLGSAGAHFVLKRNTLQVVATGLSGVKAPISIDPSVTVTTTSDFQTGGNNEGMIDFSTTSNQISRGALTGGTITGTWTNSANTFPNAFQEGGGAVYNGHIYAMSGNHGGSGGSFYNEIDYATINSDGSLGTWTQTSSFNTARAFFGYAEYNGYLYVLGGSDSTDTPLSDSQFAKINSDGSISAWQATTSLPNVLVGMKVVVANGYIYMTGGSNATVVQNTVEYASLNANGSIGTWATSGNTFTTARAEHAAVVYNDYLYIMGGTNFADTTEYNSVQYAPLNNDGTVGSFTAGPSFTGARVDLEGIAYNGYLYIMGGADHAYSTRYADVWYATLSPNGSIGPWVETNDLMGSSTVAAAAAMTYNGFLYLLGGFYGGTGNDQNRSVYIPFDAAGTASTFTTSGNTAFTTTRNGSSTVVYRGYMYVLGGYNSTNAPVSTVYRASINGDGSVSAFTADTAFSVANGGPGGLSFFGAVADDGEMYIIGGCKSAYSTCTTATNDLSAVYMTSINDTDGSLNSWAVQTGAAITTARYGLNALIYNGTMYIMGGLNASTFEVDIQYHAIPNGGGLSGGWTTSGDNLGTPRAYLTASVYNGRMYIAGGCSAGALTCTTAVTTLQFATLSISSGLAGDFTGGLSTTNSFTNGRGEFGMAIVKGTMYIVGGRSNATNYGDVQYAPITSGGTITSGTWKTSTGSTLSSNRYGFSFAASNSALYVNGGYNGTTYYNDTQYAYVNNGGTGNSGSWSSVGSALSTGRDNAGTVAYNGYLYVLGGENNATPLSDVQRASLNSGGGLGSWTTTGVPALPQALSGLAAVAYNGYLYSVQGTATPGTSGGAIYVTYYAKINYDGSLGDGTTTAGTWHTSTTMNAAADGFGNGVESLSAVAYNGYLYALGGNWCSVNCSTTQTQFAPINSDGSLGSWTISTTIPGGIEEAVSFAANGYVYLIGGQDSSGSSQENVLYAALSAVNGTIGAWSYSTALPQQIDSGSGGFYDGYVYVVGGYAGPPYYALKTTTFYAPVQTDGSIGAWQQTSNSFTTGRGGNGAVMYNGYEYVVAGGDGTNELTDTQSAPLNVIPRVGQYSKFIDLGGAYSFNNITYHGTLPGGTNNINFRSAGANGVFGSLTNAASGGSPSAGCSSSYSLSEYLYVTITLDDSYGNANGGAVFPDASTTNADITDFTVNYSSVAHPPPNIRLRAGQTLQTGSLSPLDTCLASSLSPGPAPVVASAGTAAAGTTSVAPGVPSGVTSGALVVAFVWAFWFETSTPPTTAAFTPPTGSGTWNVGGSMNYLDSDDGGYILAAWYYKYATGSDSGSYSFGVGSVASNAAFGDSGYAARITGATTSGNPFVDSFRSGSDPNADAAVTVSSFTPGGNSSLLLAGVGQTNSGTLTAPVAWTIDAQSTTGGSLDGVTHGTQSLATATGNLTFNSSQLSSMFALIGTIRPQ